MKFTKMSLVAALLVGSSAFALENVKISGDAQLFYSTNDAVISTTQKGDLFSAQSSAADAGLHLGVTADLVKNVSAGASMTALSTLGLENNLVNSVWGSSHTYTASPTTGAIAESSRGAKVNSTQYFNEAWLAATVGKTTVKLGRMELDTPLAFTEKWSIERNTFDAVVAINQNIPNTTLVGAYVGNGNGTEAFGEAPGNQTSIAIAGVVNNDGKFTTYGSNGAYAIGAINNSYKPLVAQAWYYDVSKTAQAYWLQGDLTVDSILLGAQYSVLKVDNGGTKDDKVLALMAGYVMKDMFTAKVAYSVTNKDGALGQVGFNTATAAGTAQSKLYTEAWWNYGVVTLNDTTALHASVEGSLKGFDLGVYATKTDDKVAARNRDMTEIAVTASKDFGPLNTTVAYINTDRKATTGTTPASTNDNTLQAYLTLNF